MQNPIGLPFAALNKAPDAGLMPPMPAQRSEAEIIAARIASHARWQRRARWLRLRAALFGRHKAYHAREACDAAHGRPVAA